MELKTMLVFCYKTLFFKHNKVFNLFHHIFLKIKESVYIFVYL